MPKAVPLESEEQEAFINYCHTKNIKVISSANGMFIGNLTPRQRAKIINSMKNQGMAKGFPDLMILEKSRENQILFIEMKRKKGGSLSPEQKEWIKTLDESGYCVAVARGCDEAINILNNYLNGNY